MLPLVTTHIAFPKGHIAVSRLKTLCRIELWRAIRVAKVAPNVYRKLRPIKLVQIRCAISSNTIDIKNGVQSTSLTKESMSVCY